MAVTRRQQRKQNARDFLTAHKAVKNINYNTHELGEWQNEIDKYKYEMYFKNAQISVRKGYNMPTANLECQLASARKALNISQRVYGEQQNLLNSAVLDMVHYFPHMRM